MSEQKLFDDLHNFFLKVNKVRTDVMRKENPSDSYNYFPIDEEPENVIRKGMAQYEDLVKRFRRMDKKGGIKLSKQPEIKQPEKQTANIKTTKPKKEKEDEQEEKGKENLSDKKRQKNSIDETKDSPKKRKISDSKKEDLKEKPKRRKISDTNEDELKEKPKRRKISDPNEEPSRKRKISDDFPKKPHIIKRTVGTDNPFVLVMHEKKRKMLKKKKRKK